MTPCRAIGLALALAGCGSESAETRPSPAAPFPPDAAVDMAVEFDGVDDYANTGSANFPPAETPLTFSLWFRWGGGAGRQALLVLRKDFESGFRLAIEEGVASASRVWGDNLLGSEPIVAGQWHHLAYVSSGGDPATHILYLDGVEGDRSMLPPTNRTPTTGWLGTSDGVKDLYHGALDDVRVWTEARTAEEVAAEAAGDVPDQHPSLSAYWSFNEAGGERAADRSGHGNHAVLGDGIAAYAPARRPSGR